MDNNNTILDFTGKAINLIPDAKGNISAKEFASSSLADLAVNGIRFISFKFLNGDWILRRKNDKFLLTVYKQPDRTAKEHFVFTLPELEKYLTDYYNVEWRINEYD